MKIRSGRISGRKFERLTACIHVIRPGGGGDRSETQCVGILRIGIVLEGETDFQVVALLSA